MINPNIESRINAINSRMVARKSIISATTPTNDGEDDHGDGGGRSTTDTIRARSAGCA